ncbi:MAG: hypothetical protein IT376_02450 [Polyangiaceae bacterium]|nr:hypothetical protein [Polyangiaceae bacterium]
MDRSDRQRWLAAAAIAAVPAVAAVACERGDAAPVAPASVGSAPGRAARAPAQGDDEGVALERGAAGPAGSASAAPAASASAASSAVASAAPRASAGAEVRLPVPVPEVSWAATEGDHVLAPPREWLDAALEHGAETQAFVYYAARLVQRGPESSKVRTAAGLVSLLPNALVLPLRPGQRVKKGQIVLTSWASGTGLERAIVVGGEPGAPRVRYLDMAFDAPSGWGQRDDVLPEGTFHALERAGEIGTTVACVEGGVRRRWIVVAAAEGKLLGLGFGGLLRALDEPACDALPLVPKLEPGQPAEIAVSGVFVAGKVTEVRREIGRVFVERAVGGRKRVDAVGFGNVALGAPAEKPPR